MTPANRALSRLLAMPPSMIERIAGPPAHLDGRTVAASVHLLLKSLERVDIAGSSRDVIERRNQMRRSTGLAMPTARGRPSGRPADPRSGRSDPGEGVSQSPSSGQGARNRLLPRRRMGGRRSGLARRVLPDAGQTLRLCGGVRRLPPSTGGRLPPPVGGLPRRVPARVQPPAGVLGHTRRGGGDG